MRSSSEVRWIFKSGIKMLKSSIVFHFSLFEVVTSCLIFMSLHKLEPKIHPDAGNEMFDTPISCRGKLILPSPTCWWYVAFTSFSLCCAGFQLGITFLILGLWCLTSMRSDTETISVAPTGTACWWRKTKGSEPACSVIIKHKIIPTYWRVSHVNKNTA